MSIFLLSIFLQSILSKNIHAQDDLNTKNKFNRVNESDSLWKTYLQCQSSLGQKLLTCDPENVLKDVRKGIDDILWRMQTDVPCYCTSEYDCNRYDDLPIQSGIVAALVAFTGGDLPDNIDEMARRIYDDTKLASSALTSSDPIDQTDPTDDEKSIICDNGLLVIYAIDTRTLFFLPGSALNFVFDHLPVHRRRIEPAALIDYFDQMLAVLQNKPSKDAVAVRQFSLSKNFSGWEVVVGMIAALIIALFAGAALLAIFFARCFGGASKNSTMIKSYYLDQEKACKRYEKECKEWTKRTRHLAKQRSKMIKAMQKPNWNEKVEAAKRRLAERQGSAAGSNNDLPLTHERQSANPYYIVSEPSSYNNNRTFNWASTAYEDGETMQAENANANGPGGTIRSANGTIGQGKKEKSIKRETQRRDFYFLDE